MKKNAIFFCSLFFCTAILEAKIWQVGSPRIYKKPSAVAVLVADGDTVAIDAEFFFGDVAKWTANDLVIKGIGSSRTVLDAAGQNAEGKAIWVIKGQNCRIENIEFSGCKVPDQNGAGIRQEGKNLRLENCFFHHNEMGILTSNDGMSDYIFEYCEFAFNGFGDGYSHNVYVGKSNSLTMKYCYSHDSKVGHLVKSRAQQNYLFYNRFTGEGGDGSYEIDFPNGGLAILIGNLIEQSTASQNGGIVAFGLEGATNAIQKIALAANTLVNDRFDGRFLQYSGASSVKMVGNLFAGPGTWLQGSGAAVDSAFNFRLLSVPATGFLDASNFDYRLLAQSPCVDAGPTDFGFFEGFSLLPEKIYAHPLAFATRTISGQKMDIGAYEFVQSTFSSEPILAENEPVLAFPNPFFDYIFLKNAPKNACFELTDALGRIIFFGQKIENQSFEKLSSGVYQLRVLGQKAAAAKLFKQ